MLLVLQSPLQNCSVLTLFIFMMQTCQVFLGSVAWFMASCFFHFKLHSVSKLKVNSKVSVLILFL